jgi:hypothetical protein
MDGILSLCANHCAIIPKTIIPAISTINTVLIIFNLFYF